MKTAIPALSFVLLGSLADVALADFELIKVAPERVASKNDGKMPVTQLARAKLFPPLGAITYRIATASPECQAFFDQGLNYYYSYVWLEAARSFETASLHDPECAIVHCALSKAIEKWGKGQSGPPLAKAKELLPKATSREALLIKSRMAEKGLIDGVAPEQRRKEAVKYLDELLMLYEDDEEAWFARAQLAEGPNASVPYYKALLRVNPRHAGAHHELVHHYENIQRPALGWPHAVKYIESASGVPHAYHMQSHLATRIGKWDKSADWSSKAIQLQREYHKHYNVQPNEDWQYSHHLETLTISLVHDGRFREAREIQAFSKKAAYTHDDVWLRLHVAEGDWPAALAIADAQKKDKVKRAYYRALVFLGQQDAVRAAAEVNVLQDAFSQKRGDGDLELRLLETRGMLSCLQGQCDGGLKLLEKAVDKTKNVYRHHSWGRGAYYMELWGDAALLANKLDIAEEAYLESLAHDSGSVRGAIGMQLVCERQGRTEEAVRFAELASRCWRKADMGRLETLRENMRRTVSSVPAVETPTSAGKGEI